MSSILKALKKLEEQSIEDNTLLAWPDAIGTKKYRSASKKRKKYFFFLIIPILIMAAIGGYVFYHSDAPMVVQEKVIDLPLNSPPTKPIKNIAIPSVINRELNIELDNTSEKELLSALVPVKTPEEKTEINDKETYPSNKIEYSSLREDEKDRTETSENMTVSMKDKKPEVHQRPVVQKKTSKSVIDKMASVEIIEDSRIELQAIAWAPDAKDSFVVINNRIVREGGSVKGIKILKIFKETVVFEEGTTKWQQEFRVK